MQDCKVNILGTEYEIFHVEKYPEYLSEFQDNADALCNSHDRKIFVVLNSDKDMTEVGRERLRKKSLRHEIVHAFLFESGLSANTYGHVGAWAEHEEMVDWFAIQSPKIYRVFNELGLL